MVPFAYRTCSFRIAVLRSSHNVIYMPHAERKVWVEISASALRHNVREIRSHVSPSGVMAVVKANAYGHGILEVAKTIIRDVDWLGVDNIEEAAILRKNGITKPILIIGYIPLERIRDCATYGCSFVAYNKETLRAIKKLKAKQGSFNIHVKIETGTTRQGLEGEALASFVKEAAKIPSINIEGAYTHYANIEDTTDSSYAMKQLKRFQREIGRIRQLGINVQILHTACSAAAILYPETRFDVTRLGISLYGHWPSKETLAVARRVRTKLELKPALTWKTVVAQVKEVPKGTPISYGLTETLSRRSSVAVIPVGYWDGLDRKLSTVGYVLIRGRRCKILGRICMNMTIVDVTDVPTIKLGDEVVLIGAQGKERISAEDIASKIGTIQYEILTRINPLIERRIVQ